MQPAIESLAKSRNSHRTTQRRAEQRFTLEEAFCFLLEPDSPAELTGTERDLRRTHLDLERGIRATALLVGLLTDGGNRALDGIAATGLAGVLEFCAGEIARVEKVRRSAVGGS